MTTNSQTDSESRLQAAFAWRLRLQEDPAAQQGDDYATWMADARNRAAWADSALSWDAFAEHDAAPEVMNLRHDAVAYARRTARWRWLPLPTLRQAAAAAIVAAAVGTAIFFAFRSPSTYETAIGERRVVALADGSRLSLDSDTKVRVRYARDVRALELDHGRARFDVAHDAARPFTVTAGDETVLAVGTSFNVERLESKVVVTLLEGRVVVSAAEPKQITSQQAVAPSPRAPVSLAAGQQLVVNKTTPAVTTTNLQTASAWESGQLVFYDEPLGEAVARVNRYIETPVGVDPAVRDVRISGMFLAADVVTFVDAITTYFPVEAKTSGGRTTLIARR